MGGLRVLYNVEGSEVVLLVVGRKVGNKLIVEGQEAGQVVAGNPDQLVIAIQSCLQGFAIEAAFQQDHTDGNLPNAQMLLRLLQP